LGDGVRRRVRLSHDLSKHQSLWWSYSLGWNRRDQRFRRGTHGPLLLTPEEHPAFYAATFKEGGLDLPNVLVDATIACLPDTDDDGCTDVAESQILYHPVDPSDFYSVPVPVYPDANPNGLKDQAVTVTDVVGVLRYVGTFEGDKGSPNPNGVAYDTVKGSCPAPFAEGAVQREGLCYDRSPSPLPNPPYDAGPPDGAVNVQDVVAVLRQVGLDCAGPP
jgi:hypothetical protein